MDALVTTEWLAGELGKPDLCIFDASGYLPEHGRDGRSEFAEAHIPGAVFFDFAAIADKSNPAPAMLPPAAQFAEQVGALGVGEDCRIVIYDASPMHTSSRAWWMFRRFGKPAAILDGGFAKWLAEGRPVEAGTISPVPKVFTPGATLGGVRSLAEMLANVETGAEQVADARGPARFAGGEPEPRPGVEPGHIPGSRNLHYAGLFEADGTYRRGEALAAAFAAAGIDPARPLAATCGSGVTAASIVFAAHLLGNDAALYDGSWSEWGADPRTPKAKGAA